MNKFQQHFLSESVDQLQHLKENLSLDFSEDTRREIFRAIHTLKGGAQTFGFAGAARLAHELENLLSRPEIAADENLRALLGEGIGRLIDVLRQNPDASPDSFLDQIRDRTAPAASRSDILLTQIPPDVFKKFSETEKTAAVAALRRRKKILCAEVGFESANFAAEYRNLRKALGEKGNVIAALPSEQFAALGKIGFQIFLASDETAEEFQQTIEDFSGEIISHTCADDSSSDLYEMLSQLTAHGEELARKLGKEVEISILASDTQLSAGRTKLVFDILLHLVRNAVDHAIEQRGVIDIRLFAGEEGLYLTVADDGRGVDLEAVRTKAIAQGLIMPEADLSEQQTLELIFASGISTARAVSDISGRGAGLEAVKALVEKSAGKISVRNRKTKGTIFDIFLPPEAL
jgi:two-component system chemotaxis sensor kinase CheA